MTGKLSKRTALVTGGGRGIGRAIALAYAREGAKVAVVARSREEIENVAKEIEGLGSEGYPVACDLMDREAIKRTVADVADHFGRIDILANIAGGLVGDVSKLLALTHDDDLFEQNVFLNLTAAYYMTRHTLPYMVEQDHGRILFTGSGYSKRGGGPIAYTAAKHGLTGLTRALVHQVPTTITVNTLCPGWTHTRAADFNQLASGFGMTPEEMKAMAESENIQNRVLEPEELGPMAALLAADESYGITGQLISVDGGYKI